MIIPNSPIGRLNGNRHSIATRERVYVFAEKQTMVSGVAIQKRDSDFSRKIYT